MSVDPITVEIIRCALRAAANEMSVVLKKTAYNMMIYEVQDYCVSIVDHEGRTMSQNEGALPIFLADLGVAVQDGVEVYGLENIQPGDVFLVELKNGKAARTTNLLAKVRAALLPDYRKAKAGKYNDTYDFVFEEADNNGFEFGGAGHVRINVFATTDPKGVSNSVWEGRFTGAWDIGHAKFTSAKVTREFAGTREHKPED